jgi:multiple sugar transport system substrate-binding protein
VPFERYEEKVRTLMSAKTPPDVVECNDDYIPLYSLSGWIAPLDDYIKKANWNKDDYLETFWLVPVKHSGMNKHTGLAVAIAPRLFYYNVDLFKQRGVAAPPKTWDADVSKWNWEDFVEIAKKLTFDSNGDGKVDVWGTSIIHDWGFCQTWAANNNWSIYSEDGRKYILADPQGVEVMQWLADLTLKHHVQPEFTMLKQPNDMFAAGQLATIFGGSYTIPELRQKVSKFEWDATSVPGHKARKNEGGWFPLTISAESKHKDESWRFLAFCVSKEGQDNIASFGGFIPTLKSSLPKFIRRDLMPKNIDLVIEAQKFNEPIRFTKNTAVARFIDRPQFPKIWSGEQTAKQVLEGVRAEIETVLAK